MTARRNSKQEFSYQALMYTQRSKPAAPSFLLFHAPASEIKAWADVDRLGPDNLTGAQRPLRDLKVNKVANYFEAADVNTIPTSVIIALDTSAVSFSSVGGDKRTGRHGTLVITSSDRQKPGLIIDGQHRVFGADKFDPDVHLNVVAFLGEDDDAERAFQFVVINNSASRVSKDHVKALNLNFDKKALNERLIHSARLGLDDTKFDDLQAVDSEEPFKGMLQWATNVDGFIPPSAIESGIAETRDRAALLGIRDLELDFFLKIWTLIKKLRKAVWRRQPESRLLQKVSIHALTVHILDSMEGMQRSSDTPIDFTGDEALEDIVTRLVKRIPEAFWTADWTLKELDTASGRSKLKEALGIIDANVRYERKWYEDVPLIDPALLADDLEQPKSKGTRKTTAKKHTPANRRSKKVKR